MPTAAPCVSVARSGRRALVLLALVGMSGCVSIRYPRPGREITPRAGETLVFGRVRFFHDGREFFPWNVSLVPPPVGTDTERHLWLLRLGRRAVSAELHPDPDGSLALWLASGDYALIGSTRTVTSGAPPYQVVALLRVPAGPVAAYAGELHMRTERREGGHLSDVLGEKSVTLLPMEIARVTLEQRLGALPETPVLSAWCAGEHLPGFNDATLATRAKELLDRACADAPGPALGTGFTVITATATLAIARPEVISGAGQTAIAGTQVAVAPAVRVLDVLGNPVLGLSVTFTPSGNGIVSGSPAQLLAGGIATPSSWRLATIPGENTLTITVPGFAGTVTLTAIGF